MARRWTRWWVLALGLAVLGTLAGSAQAQLLQRLGLVSPPADDNGPFGSPDGPQGPDFPNPATKNPLSPFSLSADARPNGVEDYPDSRFIDVEPYRVVFRAEYLNWRIKDGIIPITLVTTATGSGAGTLGEPDTRILLGAGPYDYGRLPGGRVTGGIAPGWFLPVEISGYWINQEVPLFSESSSTRVLGRPVYASNVQAESVFLASFPPLASGGISVITETALWGIQANLVYNLIQTDSFMLDIIAGYKYNNFREDLTITNTLSPQDSRVAVPFGGITDRFSVGFATKAVDEFKAINEFNGGQFGVRGVLSTWRFNLMLDAKLAIGDTASNLDVNGVSSLTSAIATSRSNQSLTGGVLALFSNIGTQSRHSTTVNPEANAQLGYQLTRSIRVFGGYNAFYWSRVVRPASQLNNIVDVRQAPTDITYRRDLPFGFAPQPTFNTTDLWGQGYNFGIEFSF